MIDNIDILLATYNGEKYLKEQIDSILNQTYKNIRLIISDDCSTDDTKNILNKYEKKDNRIKVFYQEKNLGYIKNFEFLLTKVESKFYMLSDQDDVWLPQKVEKSLEKIQKENADMVFSDLEVVDSDLKTVYNSFNDFMLLTRKINKYIDSYKLNYLYNCVTGCTIISKKQFIKYILPIPSIHKEVAHDYWMALMVSLNGKMSYMPERYIKYRQHGNNQIGTDKISHKFKKLEQVRNLFINVKLGIFNTYVENNSRFPKELQKINCDALEYYKMIKEKKCFNFKNWNVFHKLYKDETFVYYMQNFCIMNLPLIGRFLFKVRYIMLKIRGKR